MKRNDNRFGLMLFLLGTIVFFCQQAKSQTKYDSLNLKLPKHYFNYVFIIDGYNKPKTNLDTAGAINKHLKTYGIKEFDLSFYLPLYTQEQRGYGADSNVIENSHLLLTGNFMTLRPQFDGISQHKLTKRGIGLRYIYNSGKKGLWFFDVSPFVTRDMTYTSRPYFRLASTIIYSYNATDKLNFRLGLTKSFLWGNRLYLPFIGLRVGRLDKMNLSIQFPRSISINLPVNPRFIISAYSRPQGGMFNFSNHDTLYPKATEATFHFTRYEINTGLRFDVRLGSHFSFNASAGFSTRNNITFYSDKANNNRPRLPYKVYFYNASPSPTLFVQAGLVLKFGKTRSYYNNRNIYDAIDLNNTVDMNSGNLQVPVSPKKAPKNPNLQSIQDLIDYNDF